MLDDPGGRGDRQDALINKMVGRDLGEMYSAEGGPRGKKVLEVERVHPGTRFQKSTRGVRGRSSGFSGWSVGRTEPCAACSARSRTTRARSKSRASRWRQHRPEGSPRGSAFCPKTGRGRAGALPPGGSQHPRWPPGQASPGSGSWAWPSRRESPAKRIAELRVRTPSMDQKVAKPRRREPAKVVVAKWLAAGREVLILDEPTRGIDVGAKVEIYKLIETCWRRPRGPLRIVRAAGDPGDQRPDRGDLRGPRSG